MKKNIERIKYKSNSLTNEINIQIDGKNLIITGGNGCGKTTFLNTINKHFQHAYIEKKHDGKTEEIRNVDAWKRRMDEHNKGSSEYEYNERQHKYALDKLERYNTGIETIISNPTKFCALLDEGKAIYKYFVAERKAEINESSGATKVDLDDKILNNKYQANEQRLGNEFENHLVNLRTRQSFAETYDKDFELSSNLQQWFDELEKNISILMEDDSFKLKFDSDKFRFFLIQDNKAPYNFQNLSSGYSSIFSIVSELIMMTEAYKISPKEIYGVVLIDEIDAHLHVSLQRKILPFLSNLYPNIQFIVTTHSPFVISSLDNAVVYDLSTKQEFTNLSNYSYETIVEGLLGVPVVSMLLENNIMQLSNLLNNNPDVIAIKKIVEKLSPHKDKLDDESSIFLIKAEMLLRENKKGA